MPTHKLMISHASEDSTIAQALATVFRRCSLNQIQVWFSTDPTQGGIGAGQRWFDRVREELVASSAVAVLLTPNSVSSSWVQFEAGFGAGTSRLELIPITVGLNDLSLVPSPLSHWQIFKADDLDQTVQLIRKLFGALEIHVDDDFVGSVAGPFVGAMRSCKFDSRQVNVSKDVPLDDALRRYLEQKFFDLTLQLPAAIENISTFDILFKNTITADDVRISVGYRTTIQDVLDGLYYSMDGKVDPFRYLEQWIIVDDSIMTPIVVRGVQDNIPARLVFNAMGKYTILKLSKPYDPRAWRERGAAAR